jgi:hypothetical protein
MLDVKCQERLEEVRKYAAERGITERLEEKLAYLGGFACPEDDPGKTRCEIFADFAPHSFAFNMYTRRGDGDYVLWFNGGLIYTGPGQPLDGGFPALTVSLVAQGEGWSVHT